VPEEIGKILELAEPPAVQPPAAPTVSTTAQVGRVCGFLALGSMILFWLMIVPIAFAEGGGGIARDLTGNLLLAEGCLLMGLSVAVAITAIVGFVAAKRHPRNRRVVVWAIVLAVVAVTGYIVPIVVILSQLKLRW
jgi:hypothetical protein